MGYSEPLCARHRVHHSVRICADIASLFVPVIVFVIVFAFVPDIASLIVPVIVSVFIVAYGIVLWRELPLCRSYFILTHCHSSLQEGRLPCIKMPTRKIFDASQVVAMKVA